MAGFRRDALLRLTEQTDRDRYNLPERVDEPVSLGEDIVHLPLYLVRANGPHGRVHHLAYGQPAARADPELSRVCSATPEIFTAIDSDDRAVTVTSVEGSVRSWLQRNRCTQAPARPLPAGGWQVDLPVADFGPDGLPLAKLGSFQLIDGAVVRVWCDDREVRTRAFLDRTASFVGARAAPRPAEVERFLTVLVAQLQLPPATTQSAARSAAAAGRMALARKLERLTPDRADASE